MQAGWRASLQQPQREGRLAAMDIYNPHRIRLDNMEIAVRTRAVREAAGCATLADILLFGRRRMAMVRGCGVAVLNNIEAVAVNFGYGF